MKKKRIIEELCFLKSSWSEHEGKEYHIFQNNDGNLRAIEAEFVAETKINPGTKFIAHIKPKGCAGRLIEKIYLA